MKKILLAAAAIGLVAAGCSESEQLSSNMVIDVAGTIGAPTVLKVSDLGKKITYIPLETTDSALLPADVFFEAAGNAAIFFNGRMAVTGLSPMTFSLSDGKFIGFVGHGGQDPQAYNRPYPRLSDDGKTVYYNGYTSGHLLSYTLDGVLKADIVTPRPISAYQGVFRGDEVTASTGASATAQMFYTFKLDSDAVDSSYVLRSVPPIPMPERDKISSVTVKIPRGALRNAGDQLQNLVFQTTDGVVNMVNCVGKLYSVGDSLHYSAMLSDTIFTVAATGDATPAYIFNFGDKLIPVGDVSTHEFTTSDVAQTGVVETEHLIVFGVTHGPFCGRDAKDQLGLFDKRTGTTRMMAGSDGFIDDLTGFPIPFVPATATPDGRLVGLLSLDDLDKWAEDHPGTQYPDWVDLLVEDANPILVIVEP